MRELLAAVVASVARATRAVDNFEAAGLEWQSQTTAPWLPQPLHSVVGVPLPPALSYGVAEACRQRHGALAGLGRLAGVIEFPVSDVEV